MCFIDEDNFNATKEQLILSGRSRLYRINEYIRKNRRNFTKAEKDKWVSKRKIFDRFVSNVKNCNNSQDLGNLFNIYKTDPIMNSNLL